MKKAMRKPKKKKKPKSQKAGKTARDLFNSEIKLLNAEEVACKGTKNI